MTTFNFQISEKFSYFSYLAPITWGSLRRFCPYPPYLPLLQFGFHDAVCILSA